MLEAGKGIADDITTLQQTIYGSECIKPYLFSKFLNRLTQQRTIKLISCWVCCFNVSKALKYNTEKGMLRFCGAAGWF